MLEANILICGGIVLFTAAIAIVREFKRGKNLTKRHYGNGR